jgi:hypothetical protein
MKNDTKSNQRLFGYQFGSIYKLYLAKVERKNHTQAELNTVLIWLTGHSKLSLQKMIDSPADLQTFFEKCPKLNPNVSKITGVICGIRVEEITDPTVQKIRYMDKLVDELASGKKLEKILRT